METIIVERAGGVVTVTLNRPEKKNAANALMWSELLTTFSEVAGRTDDRVVVVTGAGGAFCSGADLSDRDRAGDHPLARMARVGEVALALHRLPQPTVAQVGGVAVGAGANLALGCDLIVASEEARFSEIFVRRGLSIDFGGSWLLPRLVGLHKAKELALLGDILSAEEAVAMGLVNRVVPAAELEATVAAWAGRLAAGPPLAMAMTKSLLNRGLGASMEEAVADEGRAQAVNFATEDTAEALAAFRERREPRFRGR